MIGRSVKLMLIAGVLVIALAGIARGGLPLLLDWLLQKRETQLLSLSYDRMQKEGDFLTVRRRLTSVRVETPSGLLMSMDSVRFSLPAWDWRRLEWQAEGTIRVERPGRWVLTVIDGEGQARLMLSAMLWGDASLPGRIGQFEARAPVARLDLSRQQAAIEGRSALLTFDNETVTILTASASDLRLQGFGRLGAAIPPAQTAAIRLRATPALPSDSGLDALTRWREEFGTLRIEQAQADMGPMQIDIRGKLALDEGLQPTGDGTVGIGGFDEFVTLLIDTGTIPPDAANLTRLLTRTMAAADQDGDPDRLSLPLSLRDGAVYAGEFLIARLPIILWRY